VAGCLDFLTTCDFESGAIRVGRLPSLPTSRAWADVRGSEAAPCWAF
jgi:hypothetical protein